MDTAQLKKVYKETIAPSLQKQFNYASAMQIPALKKIVINQGLGDANNVFTLVLDSHTSSLATLRINQVMDTAQLKKVYKETIAPALQKQFNYSSAMEIPVLKKIVINQGLGDATQDKKIVDVAINEITAITGQKAVATYSKKDIANFKLRKKMPIGVMVTLRRERMYEFLEKLVRVSLPRIRDFKRAKPSSSVLAVVTKVMFIPWMRSISSILISGKMICSVIPKV